MLVRKTKGGRFVFELGFNDRQDFYCALISYLETESAKLVFNKLRTREELTQQLEYTAFNNLFLKYHSKIASPMMLYIRFSITQFEAILLLSFLCGCGKLETGLQNLKDGLHQKLS